MSVIGILIKAPLMLNIISEDNASPVSYQKFTINYHLYKLVGDNVLKYPFLISSKRKYIFPSRSYM